MFGAAPSGSSSLTRSNSFGGGPSAKKPAPTFSFGPAANNPSNTPTLGSSTGGFSFGNTNTSTNQQQGQQQPAQSGFSFGNSTNNNTNTGGGLFASSQAQNPAQPQSSGFSFGGNQPNNTNTNQQASTGGGFSFGNTGVLFGQSQSGNNGAGGGGGLFGQSIGGSTMNQSQNQTQNQMPNTSSPFASYPYYQKERFNDLPEKEKKLIEELEIRDEILSKDFKHEDLRKALQMCSDIESSLGNLDASLSSDAKLVQDLSSRIETDRTNHMKIHEIALNAKNGNLDSMVYKDFPNQFFAKEAAEFRERVNRYRTTMEQLERTITSATGGGNQPSPQAIEQAIHAQHQSFMYFASQLASLHSDVESIKKDYRDWYRQNYRSVVDPFAGIESV